MDNKVNQVYKWMVKRGSISLFQDGDKIQLELDKENNESCLLTKEDAEEVISILTSIAEAIWRNPDFVKEPYKGQLFKTDHNKGQIYWDFEHSALRIGFNVDEDALEIDYSGDAAMKVSVNYAVEIIQIVSHYYKQFET